MTQVSHQLKMNITLIMKPLDVSFKLDILDSLNREFFVVYHPSVSVLCLCLSLAFSPSGTHTINMCSILYLFLVLLFYIFILTYQSLILLYTFKFHKKKWEYINLIHPSYLCYLDLYFNTIILWFYTVNLLFLMFFPLGINTFPYCITRLSENHLNSFKKRPGLLETNSLFLFIW